MSVREKLFIEKYRPQKISDCILPSDIKKMFEGFIAQGDFPNIILHGSAGTGKTTVARALCNELDMEYIFINASEDRNISMVRDDIHGFAGKKSLMGKRKCIILDEGDGLSAAAQGALRGVFEKYSDVRFIITCNFINKIIEPISKSRLKSIQFSVPKDEQTEMMKQVILRLMTILKSENINFDPKVVAQFVKLNFPDIRKILNEIQAYSSGGDIDVGILSRSYSIEDIAKAICEKDWKTARQWLAKNSTIDTATFYSQLEKELYDNVLPESIPAFVKILADYMNTSVHTPSAEINNAGMIASIFMDVDFK
jgi:DNA polymerase III delta prime subunit